MPSNILNVVPHGNYLAQYNGYTWDPAVTRTEMIRSAPEWDSARRTIKYVRTTIHLAWHVFLPPTTGTIDATMDALKQRLESAGGALYYRDKGFGDFQINVPGGIKKDVAWGPHPGEFTASPVADSYCWECKWSVEVCIPWCDAAKFENSICEWNYQWYSDKDDGGYETRRIVGHIEIAMTRAAQGDRLVRSTADDYREVIQPRCPPFFRPTISYFNLSEDRRTLTFNFSYEQMPGPVPPPGVLKVSMPTGHTNQGPGPNFCQWEWELSADYELIAGVPHAVAFEHFQDMRDFLEIQIRKQINTAKLADAKKKENKGAKPPGGRERTNLEIAWPQWGLVKGTAKEEVRDIVGAENPGKEGDKLLILPMTFSARNPDYFGKPKCSFSMTHKIAGTQATFLTAGLWERLPGANNWDAWYKKASQVFSARGITDSHFDPADDVIIDLCRQANISTLKGVRPKLRTEPVVVSIAGGRPRAVDPECTWIDLDVRLEFLQDDSVLVHKSLPQDRALKSRRGGSTLRTPGAITTSVAMSKYIPPSDSSGNGGFQYAAGNQGENISTIARQTASTYTVVLYGEGVRVGIQPIPFNLISIGGVPAVSANDSSMGDGSNVIPIGNVGEPIFYSTWQFRYLLPCAPGSKSIDPDTGINTTPPSTPSNGTGLAARTSDAIRSVVGQSSQSIAWGMRRY